MMGDYAQHFCQLVDGCVAAAEFVRHAGFDQA
jgi:hypothetical protein